MVNKVILMGYTGSDPVVRVFENGSKITKIRLATTERYINQQTKEPAEYTQWHSLIFRNKGADFAERYLVKGSLLYVEGKLHTRNWESSDKVVHHQVEILVDEYRLLSKPKEDSVANTSAPKEDIVEFDDLPF